MTEPGGLGPRAPGPPALGSAAQCDLPGAVRPARAPRSAARVSARWDARAGGLAFRGGDPRHVRLLGLRARRAVCPDALHVQEVAVAPDTRVEVFRDGLAIRSKPKATLARSVEEALGFLQLVVASYTLIS